MTGKLKLAIDVTILFVGSPKLAKLSVYGLDIVYRFSVVRF